MPRLPKLRLNFDSDIQYLLRLKHAIEEDKGYPSEFRDAVCSKIVEMTRLLTTAPKRKENGDAPLTPHKKAKRA